MDFTSRHSRFAEVAVAGLNIQPGQSLAIKMQPEQIEVATAVAEAAYRRGARYVDMWSDPERFLRSRLDHAAEEQLDYVPGYRALRNAEFIRDKWALLSLKSPVDLSVLDGVDAQRAGRVNQAFTAADAPLRKALGSDETQWLVMPAPAPRWASQVMDIADGDAALDAMWRAFDDILRLGIDDPPSFWRQQRNTLQERAKRLKNLGITTLHFDDDGTSLEVPLHEKAVWHGGGSTTSDGIEFSPNIPTEEVYTAPYAPGVKGRVAVTRPVRVLGGLVEGAWFTFQDGRVVDFGADRGRDLLDAFISVDDGSAGMGEIALVDSSSPIFQSGVVFQNILLDENAACHFALGSAYTTCLEGGTTMSDEELSRHGANLSRQHLDFMIGSDDIDVTATCNDGNRIGIIKNGRFVL